jgi:hypothetical protein
MKQFEVGKSYTHGWIGDADLFTTWKVLKRTAQTITIKHGNQVKTCRIIKGLSEMNDAECIYPYGKYSMCQTLRANREGVAE